MSKHVTFSKQTSEKTLQPVTETYTEQTTGSVLCKTKLKKRVPFLINIEHKNITAENLVFKKFDFTFVSSMYDKMIKDVPVIYNEVYNFIKNGSYKKIKKNKKNDKYAIVTYSPDVSISVATVSAISKKYKTNDLKIVIFTSRARIDTFPEKSNSMFKYSDTLISSLLKEIDHPFFTKTPSLNPSQICVIGINEDYLIDTNKKDLEEIFESRYIPLSKIKGSMCREILNTHVFNNVNRPTYIIFDLSVMSFHLAPMALRNLNGKKINNLSEIDGLNMEELKYIFTELEKLNIVGIDITNYDIEQKYENDDRALKVTCETARLPVKIIFNIKENSFNIFNENSKFLICRPVVSDSPVDSGWYIFRNITENESDSKMNNGIKNKIISEIEDNIILFDPLNPPVLTNIYNGSRNEISTENSEYTMFLTTTTINEQNTKRFVEGQTEINEKTLYPAEKTRMLFEIL